MSQHHLPCFVIADGGQARFIQPGADEALHVWAALESPTLHQKAHDMGSDGPGRAFESATPTRHAMAPSSDPHERAEVAFADLVTERIRAEAAEGTFNEFVLVGPAPVLAEIQRRLDPRTQALVMGTVAKDLVNVPLDQLWPHLKPWAHPVRRA